MGKHQIDRYKYLLPIEVYELEQTFKWCQERKVRNPIKYRNGIMLECLLRTGVRGSELLQVRPMDLYHDKQAVYIQALKGGANREIPMQGHIFEGIAHFAEGVPSKEPIFNIELRTLQGIWYEMRPEQCDKKLHSLRHTFSINLYRKTKDILLLKRALGHRSIQSTLVYSEHLYEHEAFDILAREHG